MLDLFVCSYTLKMSASLLQTVLMIESGHLSGFHERKRLTRYVSYGRSRHPPTCPTPSLSKSFKSTNHPYLPRSISVKMFFLLQFVFCQSQSHPVFLRKYQLSEHFAIYKRTDAVYSSLVLKRVGGNFAQVKNPPVRCSISIEVASLPNLSFTMAITSNHTLSIFICQHLLQNREACKDCGTNMMRLQKRMITSCVVINTREERVMY